MIIKTRRAFSIVEVMVVAVVISITLAIAIPNYLKSTKKSRRIICVANLEKIDAAIDQWALETYARCGDPASDSEEEIYGNYVNGGKPRCPSGGEYTMGLVGVYPQVTCSRKDDDHKLP